MQWCNSELLSKLYIYTLHIYIYLYSHTHVCCPDIHDPSPSTSTYVTLEICRCQTCGSWHFNSATSIRNVSFAWPSLHAVIVCRTDSGVCLQSVMSLVTPESHMRCATFGDCLQSCKPLIMFPVGFLELTARPAISTRNDYLPTSTSIRGAICWKTETCHFGIGGDLVGWWLIR